MYQWAKRHEDLRKGFNADQIERNAIRNNRSSFEFSVSDETISDELPDLMRETEGDQLFQKRDLVSEDIVGGAMEVLESRSQDLGELYPFRISPGGIELIESKKSNSWIYRFCLFASLADDLSEARKLRASFELIALEAVAAFVGSGARGMRTGYPWDIYSHKFKNAKEVFAKLRTDCQDALDWTWSAIEELPDEPSSASAKDLGLDVVVWKGMPDSKGGNKYFLGQCATGKSDLEGKSHDLSIGRLRQWMRLPDTEATRTFIVPFYILSDVHVRELARSGGLVFDRSRIVKLLAKTNWISEANFKDCQELVKVVEITTL